MISYTKFACLSIRVSAYYVMLMGLRSFVEILFYVATTSFNILPPFYYAIGARTFDGFINIFFGLFLLTISDRLGAFIGAPFDDDN